jgi:hypothetical protein
MDPQLKWLIKAVLAVASLVSVIGEGRRRGWI